MKKTCTKCNIEKSVEEFAVDKRYPAGSVSQCKSCKSEYDRVHYQKNKARKLKQNKAYYYDNREKILQSAKEYEAKCGKRNKLRNMYGVDVENLPEYCQVCGRHESESAKGTLHVDHDHMTGKVRGFLCSQCNCALGLVNDSPEILEKLVRYLHDTQ